MRTPSWLRIVPVFVVVWLIALSVSGWPGPVAHATEGQRARDAGQAAMASQQNNNNEADMSADNDNNNNDNSDEAHDTDDNDNRPDVTVVPVAVPVSAPAPPPPGPSVSSVDEVSQCLANGGELVYRGPDAAIAVKSFQDNLNVTLTRVNPTSQPAPPGVLVGSYVFRLSASPCGGAPYSVLPREANLAVAYSDALAAGRDESRFALMRYDGVAWSPAPKLYRDAAHNDVSASVTGLGVYALVQQ